MTAGGTGTNFGSRSRRPPASSGANLHDSQALETLVRRIPPISSGRGSPRRRPAWSRRLLISCLAGSWIALVGGGTRLPQDVVLVVVHHQVGGARVHRGEGVGDRASQPALLVKGNFLGVREVINGGAHGHLHGESRLGGLDATALVRFPSCAFPLKAPGAPRMSGVQKRCGSSAAGAQHTGAPVLPGVPVRRTAPDASRCERNNRRRHGGRHPGGREGVKAAEEA